MVPPRRTQRSDLPVYLSGAELAAWIARKAAPHVHPMNADVILDPNAHCRARNDGSPQSAIPPYVVQQATGPPSYKPRGEEIKSKSAKTTILAQGYGQRTTTLQRSALLQDDRSASSRIASTAAASIPPLISRLASASSSQPTRESVSLPNFFEAGSSSQSFSYPSDDSKRQLRVCATHGCSTILLGSHPWTVCRKCLPRDGAHTSSAPNKEDNQSDPVTSELISAQTPVKRNERCSPQALQADTSRESSSPLANTFISVDVDVIPLKSLSQPEVSTITENTSSTSQDTTSTQKFTPDASLSPSLLSRPPPIARSRQKQQQRSGSFACSAKRPDAKSDSQRLRIRDMNAPIMEMAIFTPSPNSLGPSSMVAIPGPSILKADVEMSFMLNHVETLLQKQTAARRLEEQTLETLCTNLERCTTANPQSPSPAAMPSVVVEELAPPDCSAQQVVPETRALATQNDSSDVSTGNLATVVAKTHVEAHVEDVLVQVDRAPVSSVVEVEHAGSVDTPSSLLEGVSTAEGTRRPQSPTPPSSPMVPSSSPAVEPRREDPSSSTDLGWDSDLSDLTPLEDSGESEIDEPHKDSTSPRLPATEMPKGGQSKLGAIDRPRTVCNWKLCERCRNHTRHLQRVRAYRDKNIVMPDLSVYPPGYRICGRISCATVIPPVGDWPWDICDGCRYKHRQRRPKMRDSSVASTVAQGNEPRKRRRMDNNKGVKFLSGKELTTFVDSTPTAYQSMQVLLQSLQERVHGFLAVQARYMLFRVSQGIDISHASPTRFSFDGEFSIIADPAGGVVDVVVRKVMSGVEDVLNLGFTPSGVFVGPNSSVISQFGCVSDFKVPLSPSSSKECIVCRMAGKLELTVSWDRRHKYFPGQRIAMTFHLFN
ncbi:uncharacterized protein FIBRA_05283 [Fibroporia radiculosa]|uniref:Uncharacterized protein n=1 Tax=Fibroporia radiculosa TaxID=599839 RepID=J4IAM3_9APHY|nr:uncharacterized protein FIBRA_05283 [Fibroporia radiculosa]CCM03161.1 predicted protein [Fibroporia radiculosa]